MSIIVQYGTPAIMSGRTASVVAPKLSCGNAMVYAQVARGYAVADEMKLEGFHGSHLFWFKITDGA